MVHRVLYTAGEQEEGHRGLEEPEEGQCDDDPYGQLQTQVVVLLLCSSVHSEKSLVGNGCHGFYPVWCVEVLVGLQMYANILFMWFLYDLHK